MNGGTCVDAVNGFRCGCVAGYSGLQCQTEINECSSQPCLFGGTCVDALNGFSCICAPFFSGSQCQYFDSVGQACAALGCVNGATCVVSNSTLQAGCDCLFGFIGVRCEVELPLIGAVAPPNIPLEGNITLTLSGSGFASAIQGIGVLRVIVNRLSLHYDWDQTVTPPVLLFTAPAASTGGYAALTLEFDYDSGSGTAVSNMVTYNHTVRVLYYYDAASGISACLNEGRWWNRARYQCTPCPEGGTAFSAPDSDYDSVPVLMSLSFLLLFFDLSVTHSPLSCLRAFVLVLAHSVLPRRRPHLASAGLLVEYRVRGARRMSAASGVSRRDGSEPAVPGAVSGERRTRHDAVRDGRRVCGRVLRAL